MALTTYLPATYSSEKNRFRDSNGNVKIDYRKSDGSAPLLLGTPYRVADDEESEDFTLDIVSATVPSEPHITGDNSNYRRFSTDIALVSNDFQRNIIILSASGIVLTSTYVKSTFERETSSVEGVVSHTIRHEFTVTEATTELPILNPDNLDDHLAYLAPIRFVEEVTLAGLVNSTPSLVIKKEVSDYLEELEGVSTYSETTVINESLGTSTTTGKIILSQEVSTDYGATGTDVTSLVDAQIKEITSFEGNKSFDTFTTNLLYITSFKKEGDAFLSDGTSVLTDELPNYYLYSKNINIDQELIGYSANISTSNGVLLHLVMDSDISSFTPPNSQANFLTKTVYTGLFSSPFAFIEMSFTDQIDTFSIQVNEEEEVLLGDYTSETFKYLCYSLSNVLYPHGILVIPCEGNKIALSKFKDDVDVEITLSTKYTKLITKSSFESFKYLNTNKTVLFDTVLHPVNSSFTYVPEQSLETKIVYKIKIDKDTNRENIYLSERIRLLINPSLLHGTTQQFKMIVEEGVLDTSFTFTGSTNVNTMVDMVADSLDTFLDSKYNVERNYLSTCIDIVNTQPEGTSSIKVLTGNWITFSSKYGGLVLESPDTTRSVVLNKYDGTTTPITGLGPIALNIRYPSYPLTVGTSTLNPLNYNFSEDLTGILTNSGSYSKNLVNINTRLRPHGYEAYPLYSSEDSLTPSEYIGISRIITSNSSKLYIGGGSDKAGLNLNLVYKSAKDLYIQRNSDKILLITPNASIEEWYDKVIPMQISARPFEIDDNSVSVYGKKSIEGSIALRDGLQINRRIPLSNSYTSVTIDTVLSPEEACKNLHMIFAGLEVVSSVTPTIEVDVYTIEDSDVKVVYNSSTGSFTVFYNQSLLTLGLDIGFEQENDIVLNYDGWFDYAYGYNSADSSSVSFETSSKAKTLLVSFDTTIDGV